MKLIHNWRSSWRFYSQIMNSTTVAVSLIAVADLGMGLLPYWSGVLAPQTYAVLTAITGSLGYIGRLIKQGNDS